MNDDVVLLAHGSGGRLSHELVEKLFLPPLENPLLRRLDDSAVFDTPAGARLALTTDSYVVKPIFFRGGDIGRLAVCGTVNDLSMAGARPLYLTSGFVIEEGLPMDDLRRVVASMQEAAREAGVEIVAGDTKVVERGGADRLFISTAGVGIVREGADVSGANARVGDAVVLSGTIGDHGVAVLSEREGIAFEGPIESDAAPLNGLVEAIFGATTDVHVLRDPTRGGLATTLCEIARQSSVGVRTYEERIPVREAVLGACEMLGLDPLYVANEGKLVAFVPANYAEAVVAAMRSTRYGEDAAIIGEVIAESPGKVLMRTAVGGTRIVSMLTGEMLPRIC